jgi:nucleoside 2-deoxyribosyltransferase
MAFKVFLSYGVDSDEQAIVWRLQTLAAAHGIELFVPPRTGFSLPSAKRTVLLQDQIRNAIERSDCVLAIITRKSGSAVEKELNFALAKGKLIIPIVEAGVHDDSLLDRLRPIFRFSRMDPPGKIENEVVPFLNKQKMDKEKRQAVGALVAIGMGLLLLSSLAKE